MQYLQIILLWLHLWFEVESVFFKNNVLILYHTVRKQRWSTILPISTKQTITSHFKTLKTRKTKPQHTEYQFFCHMTREYHTWIFGLCELKKTQTLWFSVSYSTFISDIIISSVALTQLIILTNLLLIIIYLKWEILPTAMSALHDWSISSLIGLP
jgi:hypothetical protein